MAGPSLEWLAFLVAVVALIATLGWYTRSARRDRAGLHLSGECFSSPGCTVLLVTVRKLGMAPIQVEHVGVFWGALARHFGPIRVPWVRQTVMITSIFPTPRAFTFKPGIKPSAFRWDPPPVARRLLDRFRENSVQIVDIEGAAPSTLHFDGEVYRAEIPFEHLAKSVRELGRPGGVVAVSANQRYFVGGLTNEAGEALDAFSETHGEVSDNPSLIDASVVIRHEPRLPGER